MKMTKVMAASAAVVAVAVGGPAMAQSSDYNGALIETNSEVYDTYDSIVVNDLIDATLGSTVGDTNSYNGGNVEVVSEQTLIAYNINEYFDEIVDVDGYDGDLNTGDNYVGGSAFTAFAGIANVSFNSGVNANTQAGNSIAAYGSVTFDGAPAGGE